MAGTDDVDIAMDEQESAGLRSALFGGGSSGEAAETTKVRKNMFADIPDQPKAPPPGDGGDHDRTAAGGNDDYDPVRDALLSHGGGGGGGGGSGVPGDDAKVDGFAMDLNTELLNITGEDVDVDFDEEDVENFLNNPLVKNALAQGIDLREYAREIGSNLREVEEESIQDYVENRQTLLDLHAEIEACDDILAKMEGLLFHFQEDLGGISADIKTLQDKSLDMNIKLKNRRAVEGQLRDYIDQVLVSDTLIATVCEAPVDAAYVEALRELDRKIAFTEGEDGGSGAAADEVLQKVNELKETACARVREALLRRLHEFKKAKSNLKVRSQNPLLEHKYLMTFLRRHARPVAHEIRAAYVTTVSKVFHAYFKNYCSALYKQRVEVCDKTDVLAVDPAPKKGFFSSGKVRDRSTLFSLQGRDAILSQPPTEVIVLEGGRDDGRWPYEVIFRSICAAMMDTAESEARFTREFFGRKSRTFDAVMERSMNYIEDHLDNYLSSSHDCIAILICIVTIHQDQLHMQSRRSPCLDTWFDRLNMQLWPRFKVIFDAHITSVKETGPTTLGLPGIHGHFVMERYAQFASAMLVLNATLEHHLLTATLSRLSTQMEKLILRIGGNHRARKNQLVFLINNYDLTLGMMPAEVHRTDCYARWGDLFKQNCDFYVEEALQDGFGHMVAFVMEMEALFDELGGAESATGNAGARERAEALGVEQLARDFGDNRRTRIDQAAEEINAFFDNPLTKETILQKVLMQLMMYYGRFREVVDTCFNRPSFGSALVDLESLKVECRQIARDAAPGTSTSTA